jgi:L-fuconolactonase
MRIDAHQHFWQYSPAEYGWIDDKMGVLRADHLPNRLAPLLAAAGLDGTVAVQARQTLAETEWLLELADQNPFIKGVVGWVDLANPELETQLELFAFHSKFCGVRHVVQDEPDDRFMLCPEFLHGIEKLAAFDLVYDILIFPRHLPVACELIQQFPEQPFVLDHIAKPFIKDQITDPWTEQIQQLASYQNITCKISGMVTEADWHSWQPADFRPYLDAVFSAFGPDRLMFGSDWPVCTVAGSYSQVVELVSDYTRTLSTAEQDEIWGGTAARIYGLE